MSLAELERDFGFGLKLASGVVVVGIISALIIGYVGSSATDSEFPERLLRLIPSLLLSAIIVMIPAQIFHLLLKGFVKIAHD